MYSLSGSPSGRLLPVSGWRNHPAGSPSPLHRSIAATAASMFSYHHVSSNDFEPLAPMCSRAPKSVRITIASLPSPRSFVSGAALNRRSSIVDIGRSWYVDRHHQARDQVIVEKFRVLFPAKKLNWMGLDADPILPRQFDSFLKPAVASHGLRRCWINQSIDT